LPPFGTASLGKKFLPRSLDPEPPAASSGWLNGGRQAATVRPTGEQADRQDQAAEPENPEEQRSRS
jgi:hypothetical protein